MRKVLGYIKKLTMDAEERQNEIKKKEWQEKVEGLIPVEVNDKSDAVIFHMLIDWNRETIKWCEENCQDHFVFGNFSYLGPCVYFKNEDDAMAFKLRWT